MANHPIVHVELAANNTEAAAKFYSELFGWKTELAMGDYWTFAAEGGPGGGWNRVGMSTDGSLETKPGEVIVYVYTDDIEATLGQIEQLGGSTVLGKSEIPGMGWFALFNDPTGNKVGLFTAVEGMA